MKFFKPEDFIDEYGDMGDIDDVTKIANAKLEREGKIVFGMSSNDDNGIWSRRKDRGDSRQALIINIEPLIDCSHPKEKISGFHLSQGDFVTAQYQCECGAKVKPKEFEEFK